MALSDVFLLSEAGDKFTPPFTPKEQAVSDVVDRWRGARMNSKTARGQSLGWLVRNLAAHIEDWMSGNNDTATDLAGAVEVVLFHWSEEPENQSWDNATQKTNSWYETDDLDRLAKLVVQHVYENPELWGREEL